jgi:hypothetical protein
MMTSVQIHMVHPLFLGVMIPWKTEKKTTPKNKPTKTSKIHILPILPKVYKMFNIRYEKVERPAPVGGALV